MNVFPVVNEGGIWYPTGLNIETGLRYGQGIAVRFNKPMGENVIRSLRFEPSLSGRTENLNEESIVYIFSKDPEPETTYVLIVSGDTRDTEGLKIGADFKINFTPDLPVLRVLSVETGGCKINVFSAENDSVQVSVDPAAGHIDLLIHFSLLFGLDERQNTPQRITISPFFPRTLPPVALKYVNWISHDRLFLRWEGLSAGDEYPHYYKLTIPCGRGGISSCPGSYMNENIVINLEIVK